MFSKQNSVIFSDIFAKKTSAKFSDQVTTFYYQMT